MPINKEKQIKLSPSTLNLFLECPRCFWLEIVKYVNAELRALMRKEEDEKLWGAFNE